MVIKIFCAENLEVGETFEISRAHRIERPANDKKRPIVVKSRSVPQRELVRKSSSKLKNTNFFYRRTVSKDRERAEMNVVTNIQTS